MNKLRLNNLLLIFIIILVIINISPTLLIYLLFGIIASFIIFIHSTSQSPKFNHSENLVGKINDSNLDDLSDDTTNLKSITNNTYDPDLEYTQDKIGYMRHDMEERTRQNENYTKCYKPIKGEINDCDIYSNMPIDEQNTTFWKNKGIRDKKMMDGTGSKTAEFYRSNFNTELDREEKKVWWEVENTY
jgi:hypothetical protein